MFTCELNRVFEEVTARVPDGPPGYSPFVFHPEVLPLPPTALQSDRIVIRKMMHVYNSNYRADALWMYLSPRKCRELAVFLLACGFHGPPETTTLTLSHPESDIRRIVIPADRPTLEDASVGLTLTPYAFRYYPDRTKKHPWMHDCCTHDLPHMELSNADGCVITDEEWRGRDTVWISAPAAGTFRLAELLLNAGCSWNEVREYELEGEAGYRSVAPTSAELRIFLPGSDGWIYKSEDVPDV